MRRDINHRSVTMVAILFAAGLGAGGCGGSDAPDPADAFVGRWAIQLTASANSAFTLTCAADDTGPWPQWLELNFERGVLGDLYETSGLNNIGGDGCAPILATDPAFSYRVEGNTAKIINPDPISGKAPRCEGEVYNTAGELIALLDYVPSADWSFTLAAPENGVVKHGFLKGSATVTPTVWDPTLMQVVTRPDCTYTSSATGEAYRRITQP